MPLSGKMLCIASLLIKKRLKMKNMSFLHALFIIAHRATLFTRLDESIQVFSYLSEEQKFQTILSDGNNVKQCASVHVGSVRDNF